MRNTRATQLLFELSDPGRRVDDCSVRRCAADTCGTIAARSRRWPPTPPPLPELAEPDMVRHFTNLSTLNMSVDTHFYPLGSCTMKYNPKRNERLASLPGLADLHPYQPEDTLQGLLAVALRTAGDAGRNRRPAGRLAATGGRRTGRIDRADGRRRLFPRSRRDSARKCWPPTAPTAPTRPAPRWPAFEAVTVKSTPQGFVDLEDLKAKLDDDTAVFMITNPNTLGLFDRQIAQDRRPGARARRA